MNRYHWKKLICLLGGFIGCLCLLGFIAFHYSRPDAGAVFQEPSPNGYDDFLKALEVASVDNRIYESDETTMRAVVEENSQVIGHILEGLNKDCQVRFEPNHQAAVDQLVGLKSLNRLLILRAQLLEFEGKWDEAFQAFQDAYRYIFKSTYGGRHNHYLSWSSQKSMFMREFEKSIKRLTSKQAKAFLPLMDKIENDPANKLDRVTMRDHCWNDTAYGYRWRLNRIKFYANRVRKEQSLAPLNMLFLDLGVVEKKYQKEKAGPIRQLLRERVELGE